MPPDVVYVLVASANTWPPHGYVHRVREAFGERFDIRPGCQQLAVLDLSPVWFAHRGAATSLPWISGLDMAAVRDHCVGLADTMLTELGLAPRGSAIIALDLSDDHAARLANAGVVASTRAGRIRLSFHLYNTMADVELVLRALGR